MFAGRSLAAWLPKNFSARTSDPSGLALAHSRPVACHGRTNVHLHWLQKVEYGLRAKGMAGSPDMREYIEDKRSGSMVQCVHSLYVQLVRETSMQVSAGRRTRTSSIAVMDFHSAVPKRWATANGQSLLQRQRKSSLASFYHDRSSRCTQ